MRNVLLHIARLLAGRHTLRHVQRVRFVGTVQGSLLTYLRLAVLFHVNAPS